MCCPEGAADTGMDRDPSDPRAARCHRREAQAESRGQEGKPATRGGGGWERRIQGLLVVRAAGPGRVHLHIHMFTRDARGEIKLIHSMLTGATKNKCTAHTQTCRLRSSLLVTHTPTLSYMYIHTHNYTHAKQIKLHRNVSTYRIMSNPLHFIVLIIF